MASKLVERERAAVSELPLSRQQTGSISRKSRVRTSPQKVMRFEMTTCNKAPLFFSILVGRSAYALSMAPRRFVRLTISILSMALLLFSFAAAGNAVSIPTVGVCDAD
jgi:hypothetical protein